MTTVPGYNIVIQQSGVAQEFSHQAHSPKPSPEQAATQQQAAELVKNTTVRQFDESEKLKSKKEKDALKKKYLLDQKKKQKEREEKELDPDSTGRLVDTTA